MATRSILLIEHETSLREVLGACLRELGGWHVVLSDSIREGICLCEQQKPHVVLVDTSTPETDALLFIEQLKTHTHRQSIPILLISSRAVFFTADQLRQMGFAGAIAKPFNPSTLPHYIAKLMKWEEADP
ncbi:response regulator [Leptolyngbya iicbica]|uniref:Response regulator n=2 Tax=Cyanophyceae TaxID=3028117 RepID=A0A4Q7E8C7_9CYAN|nr:response regulator [Leptolyngbya sp. LK]RZM79430.1 response regulator [Leptolyngbya sp. LK]